MDDQRSVPGNAVPAGRSRYPQWCGVLRAILVYVGLVYALWVCYYTVDDLKAGKPTLGPLGFAVVTTLAALILFGIPTIVGTVIALPLRRRVRPGWYGLLSVLAVFGPSLYWLPQPYSDLDTILVQQIAQALFLAYLLLPPRRLAT